MRKEIDGVPFQIREDFDFSWLAPLGRVFAVFDQQDSGNICFGLEGAEGKKFVKCAGVRTMEYEGDPAKAVAYLRAAMPVYEALAHPALIRLDKHFAVPGGYAAVFDWAEGECLHAHWDFDAHPKYTHPLSPYYRFKRLPLAERLESLEVAYDFHVEVERRGYVAIDLYDGTLMYDFVRHKTTLCDVDLYAPKPYVNAMGRMWGSSRFMSPEEYVFGAPIDGATNVFTLGALAFEVLGSNRERTMAHWEADEKLFAVAKRATEVQREARYPSVAAFAAAWREALASCGC